MPYKISKLSDDGRNDTCGYFLPDGGYYHVLELTFENLKGLTNLCEKPNYTVDYCTGESGFFDNQGRKVNLDELRDMSRWQLEPDDEHKREPPQVTVGTRKHKHPSTERAEVIARCRAVGIGAEGWASTQKMKWILSVTGNNQRAAQQKTLRAVSAHA